MDELDAEIMRIKIEKMKRLLKELEERQRMKEEEHPEAKKDRIFLMILTPEAKRYYENLKQSDPSIARRLRDAILVLLVQGYINTLLTEVDLELVVRKMRGEEPKIYIKRKGEKAVSISEYFRNKE